MARRQAQSVQRRPLAAFRPLREQQGPELRQARHRTPCGQLRGLSISIIDDDRCLAGGMNPLWIFVRERHWLLHGKGRGTKSPGLLMARLPVRSAHPRKRAGFDAIEGNIDRNLHNATLAMTNAVFVPCVAPGLHRDQRGAAPPFLPSPSWSNEPGCLFGLAGLGGCGGEPAASMRFCSSAASQPLKAFLPVATL